MVEFENAGFAYGATEVLRGICLTVEPGAFCVIYGRPASGKTTLIRLCHGEIAPTEGEVRVLGRPVPSRDRNAVARLRRRIGVVAHRNRFLDHLPLGENVAAPLIAAGSPSGRSDDLAALLAWVGLAERAGDLPCALSPAESRRAALARALINSPDLILADEPTGGLAAEEASDLLAYFLELHAMGTAVLFASGDEALVEHLLALRPVQVAHLAAGRLEVVQ